MARVFRNPDVLWRREAEDNASLGEGDACAILFSGGAMLSINELGLEVWQKCDGRSLDELICALVDEFDVEEVVLRADVGEFLDTLHRKGFIRYE